MLLLGECFCWVIEVERLRFKYGLLKVSLVQLLDWHISKMSNIRTLSKVE